MKKIFGAHGRGILISLVLTLLSMFIFAIFVKSAGASNNLTKAVTQIIKVIAIFAGMLPVVRSVEKRAWMHGGIFGIFYAAFAFLIMAIIDREFDMTSGFLFELLFSIAVGIFSAMLLRLRKSN